MPRIAERADAHVRGHVGIAAFERRAAHGADREPARWARDIAARDVALAAERSLAFAREPKGESAVVIARAAAKADLVVGDVLRAVGAVRVVTADRESHSLAHGEAPVVHVVLPHALVRPEEGKLGLLEDAPLGGVEHRADRAVVGRGCGRENVRVLRIAGKPLVRGRA